MKNKVLPSKSEIGKTFNVISPSYDRINRILSLGLDLMWRKSMISRLPKKKHLEVLDCATGTGDQIFCIADKLPFLKKGIGIDIAPQMLQIAKKKLERKPYVKKVSFHEASVLKLPFPDRSFDAVTISFGIRNVTDVDLALKEMRRVLSSEGKALILEFSLPSHPILKFGHLFYLRHILPKIGGALSKDQTAYKYLSQTIQSFPYGESFCEKMKNAGFSKVRYYPLTKGIVTIYEGTK